MFFIMSRVTNSGAPRWIVVGLVYLLPFLRHAAFCNANWRPCERPSDHGLSTLSRQPSKNGRFDAWPRRFNGMPVLEVGAHIQFGVHRLLEKLSLGIEST